jgi:hypothetical protein
LDGRGGTAAWVTSHPNLYSCSGAICIYRQKDESTHFSLKVTELTLQHGPLKMCMPRWGEEETWMFMCRRSNTRKRAVEEDDEMDQPEDGGGEGGEEATTRADEAEAEALFDDQGQPGAD